MPIDGVVSKIENERTSRICFGFSMKQVHPGYEKLEYRCRRFIELAQIFSILQDPECFVNPNAC